MSINQMGVHPSIGMRKWMEREASGILCGQEKAVQSVVIKYC